VSPRQVHEVLTGIRHDPTDDEGVRLVVALGGSAYDADLVWRVLLLQTTEEDLRACAARLGLRQPKQATPMGVL
jgi:hypothetical protein